MKLDIPHSLLPAGLLPLLLAYGSPAAAAPPQLKGEYAFTAEGACLYSYIGFTSTLIAEVAANEPAYSSSFSVQGVFTFNGDGTGSVEGSVVAITPPALPTASAAALNPLTYQFTYTIANDGLITIQLLPGTFKETYVTGTRTGQYQTIDHFSFTGMASNNNSSLTLATPTTEIETRNFSNGDVRYSICHESLRLIWLGE
jgi:hypothetical protein